MNARIGLTDRYQIDNEIGFGGMSQVYRGLDTKLDRLVAIKILRQEYANDKIFNLRFTREAQNVAGLTHEHIVQVFDTGEGVVDNNRLPFIVMEYVEGDTFREILDRESKVDEKTALGWIQQACEALDYSHQSNIVHRDIKPANIMLDQQGDIKVMDFGIARAITDVSKDLTQTASVIGTARYLSPEQATGKTLDARSDIYSLGCVLFELVTGRPPFTGDTPVSVAYQHVKVTPPLPSSLISDLSRELDSIILKALSKNPSNRYQNAQEMCDDIALVLQGKKPTAPVVMTEQDHDTLNNTLTRQYSQTSNTVLVKNRSLLSSFFVSLFSIVFLIALIGFGIFIYKKSTPFKAETPSFDVTTFTVPDIHGLQSSKGQEILRSKNISPEILQQSDPIVPNGNIIKTDPPANSVVHSDVTVKVYVSTGPTMVHLPVIGDQLRENEVRDILTKTGFTKIVSEVVPSDAAKGTVIGMNPKSGVEVPVTTIITLLVSSGPTQRCVIPANLVGVNEQVAEDDLSKTCDFKVVIVRVDNAQPEGTVLKVDPDPSAQRELPAKSQVTLTISSGSVTLPALINLKTEDAKEKLKKMGVKFTTEDAGPRGLFQKPGIVIDQNPKPGTSINSTTTVVLTTTKA